MKTFIVLGMHRSATSLTAKGLNEADVQMGDNLLGKDKSNPWGHFEDRDFVNMNERILRAAGGAWNDPPEESKILKCAKDFDLEKLIRSKEMSPFWGWKDPRTTLTIRAYLPFLKHPHFIVNFRETEEVAKSLNKRDGMTIENAKRLIWEYNKRLLNFLIDFSR